MMKRMSHAKVHRTGRLPFIPQSYVIFRTQPNFPTDFRFPILFAIRTLRLQFEIDRQNRVPHMP